MKIEVWKDIDDYPNYQISSFGRVKSKERYTKVKDNQINPIKEKILKIQIDHKGYSYVRLYNENGFKSIKVHRLVANAFLDKINDKEFINHIDGDKSNNHVENLEWCTIKENNEHAVKNGLVNLKLRKDNMSKLGKKHLTDASKKVKQYSLDKVFIKEWKSSKEASKKLNISESSISNCVNGNSKSAGGYIWLR